MKKRDLAKLAFLGLASSMIVSTSVMADEKSESSAESSGDAQQEVLLARGGCGSACSAQRQGSGRNRRYNSQVADMGSEMQYEGQMQQGSCSANRQPSSSCSANRSSSCSANRSPSCSANRSSCNASPSMTYPNTTNMPQTYNTMPSNSNMPNQSGNAATQNSTYRR